MPALQQYQHLSAIHKIIIAASFSAILVLFSAAGIYFKLFESLEDRSIDYRFLIRGEQTIEDTPLVLVFVDDTSAMEYGFRSPTPRALLAKLVNALNSKGASVIGLDFVLDRSHRKADDRLLAKAFQQAEGKIVLARPEQQDSETDVTRSQIKNTISSFAPFVKQGYSGVRLGSGDVVRRMKVGPEGAQHSFVSQVYHQFTTTYPELETAPDLTIPINFLGTPTRLSDANPVFPVFAANEVSQLPDILFQDKIVLVGSGIPDLGDIFLTPFSQVENGFLPMFGVELHAIVLDMLLRDRYLSEFPAGLLFLLLACYFFCSAVCFFFLPARWSLPCFILEFFGWLLLTSIVFSSVGLILPAILPITCLIILFVGCLLVTNIAETKHSRFLKQTFKQYISPELVDQLVNHPEQINLGGETKNLTVLFSDLEGFTSFSEKLKPRDLVLLLNEYLGEMTDVLFKEKGTLDKYQGDAIMAIFGAPLEQPDHAVRACQTALHMQTTLAKLNQQWKNLGQIQLKVRIGINTGVVVVGNIGSKDRYDYTVIGDEVNLAARLEGVNKMFGTSILISESTLQELGDNYITRELGRIVVKGKTHPITVYELISHVSQPLDEPKTAVHHLYQEGLSAFYKKNFEEAAQIFTKLVKTHQDPPADFMLYQAQLLITQQPEPNWKGEIILYQK